MTTAEQWLAEGVCCRGHALYGPADLHRRDSNAVECNHCRLEMADERANIALAAAERRAAGRE